LSDANNFGTASNSHIKEEEEEKQVTSQSEASKDEVDDSSTE